MLPGFQISKCPVLYELHRAIREPRDERGLVVYERMALIGKFNLKLYIKIIEPCEDIIAYVHGSIRLL